MLFAYDTTTGLAAAAALVNSGRNGEDTVATIAQLGEFLDVHGFTGRRDRTRAELGAVQDLRDRIGRFWDIDRDEAAEEVNTILRETSALPYLTRHDDLDWHVHVTEENDPLVDRLAAEAAMAMSDLIRADEFYRLGFCAGEDCSSVIVDLSRNRSRKFCVERNCGNRANVAAYRQRQADESLRIEAPAIGTVEAPNRRPLTTVKPTSAPSPPTGGRPVCLTSPPQEEKR